MRAPYSTKGDVMNKIKSTTLLGIFVCVAALFALSVTIYVSGNGSDKAGKQPHGAVDAGSARILQSQIPFEEVKIIIEVNATDGDAGLQIFFDAEDWREVEVFGPDGQTIFEVEGQSSLGEHGMTELFIESAEPSFEDLPLEEFLLRFPAGEYRFSGVTIEGDVLVGAATLTHAIPDGPVIVSPEEDSVQDPNNTVVRWEPVADPPGSEIVGYQVIVEGFSVELPATATSVTVPPEFLEPGTEYSFEVLAIEESGNQTITESFFKTAE